MRPSLVNALFADAIFWVAYDRGVVQNALIMRLSAHATRTKSIYTNECVHLEHYVYKLLLLSKKKVTYILLNVLIHVVIIGLIVGSITVYIHHKYITIVLVPTENRYCTHSIPTVHVILIELPFFIYHPPHRVLEDKVIPSTIQQQHPTVYKDKRVMLQSNLQILFRVSTIYIAS